MVSAVMVMLPAPEVMPPGVTFTVNVAVPTLISTVPFAAEVSTRPTTVRLLLLLSRNRGPLRVRLPKTLILLFR